MFGHLGLFSASWSIPLLPFIFTLITASHSRSPSLIQSLTSLAVAYIATSIVSPSTKTYLQYLLKNDTDSYLANVATWADSFRYTAGGKFSAPFHFIDAEDDPPRSCGVKYERDCGKEGCIVGALANYVSFYRST